MTAKPFMRLALLCFLIPAVICGVVMEGQAQTTVEISPDVVQATTGANVSINVVINDVSDLHTAIVGVTFDRNIVEYVGSAAGSLLSANAQGYSIFYYESRKPNAAPDTVRIDQAILGKASVDGSGEVFTLTFKARRTGVSPVKITTIELRNSENYLIPAEQVDGTIVIGETGNRSPEISTVPPERALLAGQFSYAIQAQDPDGDPLSYRMTEGPDFLTLDEQTGILSGVPDRTGRFPVSIRVHDGKGGTAIQSFRLSVFHTEHPPSIPVQLSPANGARLTSMVDTLRWSACTDPRSADILTYALHIRSGAFDTLITGLSDPFFPVEEGFFEETRIYSWSVDVTDGYDTVSTEEVFTFKTPFLTEVHQLLPAPGSINLLASYPNPFRESSTALVRVQTPQSVRIEVYDLAGHRVRELLNAELVPGVYSVQWDGTDTRRAPVPSGAYLLALTATGHRSVRQIILTR